MFRGERIKQTAGFSLGGLPEGGFSPGFTTSLAVNSQYICLFASKRFFHLYSIVLAFWTIKRPTLSFSNHDLNAKWDIPSQGPTEVQKFPGGPSEIERQKRQRFDEIQIFGVLCAPSIHENQILKALGGNRGNEMGSLKVLEVQNFGKKIVGM